MDNSLKIIHDSDYKMMIEIRNIFDKHGLTYFLIAGTLLGAVRHGGFIPWDDDADIGVPRKSYELFLDKYVNELPDKYKVQNYKLDKDSKYYVTRILDTDLEVRETRDTSTDSAMTYASIDLFPIDGAPNRNVIRKLYVYKILFLRMLISISQSNNIDMSRKRGHIEKTMIIIAKNVPFDKIINRQKIFKLIDKNLKKYSIEGSKYSGSLMGAYREKELFPTEYIYDIKKIKFRNEYFSVPQKDSEYLKWMYNDYMTIPDKVSIEGKKHYIVMEKKE